MSIIEKILGNFDEAYLKELLQKTELTPLELKLIGKMLKPLFGKTVPDFVLGMRQTQYDFLKIDFKEKVVFQRASCNCKPDIEETFNEAEDLKSNVVFKGMDLSMITGSMVTEITNSTLFSLNDKELKFTAYFELKQGMIKLEYKIKPESDGGQWGDK